MAEPSYVHSKRTLVYSVIQIVEEQRPSKTSFIKIRCIDICIKNAPVTEKQFLFSGLYLFALLN